MKNHDQQDAVRVRHRLRGSFGISTFAHCVPLWLLGACLTLGACGHSQNLPAAQPAAPIASSPGAQSGDAGESVGSDASTSVAAGFWHAEQLPASCDAKAWPLLWDSLVGPPGEGQHASELRIRKSDRNMELSWQENNLPDDAIAAIAYRYFLRWEDDQSWKLERCEKEILRCWRGVPHEGVCP